MQLVSGDGVPSRWGSHELAHEKRHLHGIIIPFLHRLNSTGTAFSA